MSFDTYGVTVLWDGQPIYVETGALGVDPVVGMAWLHSTLTRRFEGGRRARRLRHFSVHYVFVI